MSSCPGSIEGDRAALEALFDATGGLQWRRNTGWKEYPFLSGWHGVAVNTQGRVKAVNLRLNGLKGRTNARSVWPRISQHRQKIAVGHGKLLSSGRLKRSTRCCHPKYPQPASPTLSMEPSRHQVAPRQEELVQDDDQNFRGVGSVPRLILQKRLQVPHQECICIVSVRFF